MNPLEPTRDWTLASNSSALFVDANSAGNPVSSTDPTPDSKVLTTSSKDRMLTCSLWCTVNVVLIVISLFFKGGQPSIRPTKIPAILRGYPLSNEGLRITSQEVGENPRYGRWR